MGDKPFLLRLSACSMTHSSAANKSPEEVDMEFPLLLNT